MEKIIEIDINDSKYPKELKKIRKPPKKLYAIGNLELLKKRKIGIVGSRRASNYGRWVARTLGKQLSNNDVSIVSGMAYGIDTAAHQGGLMGEASTIAVLGTGIDICFPKSNSCLYENIKNQGLILSEYPLGFTGNKWTFPQRNRIIAGLSEAIIVAEAGIKSGAMITADIAIEQSKPVFAVPGNINTTYSIGSNQLIADGGIPIVVFDDVFQMMKIKKMSEKSNFKLGEDEKKVFNLINEIGECSSEKLSELLNISIWKINGIVTILEMKGVIQTSLGKIFVVK